MTTAFAPSSEQLAQELYAILRELDPSHCRDELEASMKARVQQLRESLHELVVHVEARSPAPAIKAVCTRLTELKLLLDKDLMGLDPSSRLDDFRTRVSPAYERLAASLRHLDIHVPSLRPTNYARNIYHVSNSLGAMVLLLFITEKQALILTVSVMTLAWTLEIFRRIVPALNDFLMWLLARFAHPHEAWRVNSATWFATAMFILACMWDLKVASAAIVVLGFGDPIAAIVGRRYGRVQLVNGRTIAGTLAFVGTATLVSWLWLMTAWSTPVLAALGFALSASVPGAIAELFSRRIDDNLSIPVAAGLGMWVAVSFFG
jgi:dolichol kinase